ncbi:DUF6602 domain-containing protein [Turneriella parva]|uniref:DUF6602 domain-containing protein n=1 Tax=Turneriella parva TaxID=29510 RepID=UPI0005A53285|nr:DUF6602 domain-containing protein [Turneriella parva]
MRETLLRKSEEMQLAKHTTVIGTARELILTEFLQANLPQNCNFFSGEIIDSKDKRSGQIDILLVPDYSPRFVLAQNYAIALADAVIAAVEVKSVLTTDNEGNAGFDASLKNCKSVKELTVTCEPWPWTSTMSLTGKEVLLPNIPYIVIAFKGPKISTLEEKITKALAATPRESLPDVIVVLEEKYALVRNNDWHLVNTNKENPGLLYFRLWNGIDCLSDVFTYLMKCIQAWDYHRPPTPMSKYLPQLPKTGA